MDNTTVQLLAELGFLAGNRGLTQHADAIADALVVMRPDKVHPHMVRAYARLGARDAAGAEKILRDDVLAKAPDNNEGKTLLGLALHMAGKGSERDDVFTEVIEAEGVSAPAAEIAEKLRGAPVQ